MMQLSPVELSGVRAHLAPMTFAHVEGLFAVARQVEIFRHLPYRFGQVADMEGYVQESLAAQLRGEELPFVYVDQENGQIVGSCKFLAIVPAHHRLEIGATWLAPHLWGTHFNTECKYLLLRHCFEALRTIRVEFKTDERNMRSRMALDKIGAKQEGIFRNHMIRLDGSYRHSVYFSIIEEEWPAIKQRLERMLGKAQ